MCEKIPLYRFYCCHVSLRLGLVFIAIQSIMTGVAGLSLLELQTDVNYNKLKNFTDTVFVSGASHLISNFSLAINYGLTLVFLVFMVMGVVLLFTTLWDNESLILTFVWGIYLNVILGYTILAALGLSCALEDTCLLSSLDWISATVVFLLSVSFFSLWLYYAAVAYSYLRLKRSHW